MPTANKAHHCQARQYSDQMVCGKCGLAWDVNDPEPPECKNETTQQRIDELREMIRKAK